MMKNKKKIEIFLRVLQERDVTKKYVRWMNDYDIVKFTEQRFKRHTYSNIKNFVRKKNKSKNDFLFGIFLKQNSNKDKIYQMTEEHIGNIKLGRINFTNKTADVSYIIGEKKYWGKGIATLAVKEIIKIASQKYKLKKLQGGCWKINIGSRKVFERNKFIKEGVLKSHIIHGNKRYDNLIYGLKL